MDYLLSLLVSPGAWIALLTLIAMEIVLGIDNLIFISILSNKLPAASRSRIRRMGIVAALVLRLILLSTVAFIVQLTEPVLTVLGQTFSWRDMILIAGGLFLVWKATTEIRQNVTLLEEPEQEVGPAVIHSGLAAIGQILVLDMVFSVDSIITAVGMTNHLPIMMIAVMVAIIVMLVAADPLGDFIQRNPTIVMLALGFLLLIGTTLIADGFGVHVPRGYIYASMAFSASVEFLNMLRRRTLERRQEEAHHD